MNAKSKAILESAGLKNPKDFAMVEAIVAAQRSPLLIGILVASLVLNLVMGLVLLQASQGMVNAETKFTAAAQNLTATSANFAKESSTASAALLKASEINQNAANAVLSTAQSLPTLVASLNESVRAIDRSEAALKVTLDNANRNK